ncbi:MAG: SpoIIE family protein phosphatase [Phycisphaerae bacterium]|nr:SpoIIE family protein phosphatase [Phycisphaerae bacterium]
MSGVHSALEWAVEARPYPGEVACGDRSLVVSGRETLLAVVDGLGHGIEAARAAERAIETIAERADAPLDEIVQECHRQLRSTRGVALTLVAVSPTLGTLTWLGVGNVEALLVRASPGGLPARALIVASGGVVGHHLPPLRTASLDLGPDDLIVLATDGISEQFAVQSPCNGEPAEIARDILARHALSGDDALVLVARHGGPR